MIARDRRYAWDHRTMEPAHDATLPGSGIARADDGLEIFNFDALQKEDHARFDTFSHSIFSST
jgi:hypothetical protein